MMQPFRSGSSACWVSRIRSSLRDTGLRLTRQRLALASLLFRGEGRHVRAEDLREEADRLGIRVSLATVYNTLNQFTEAGLLRVLAVDPARTYFDTNTHDHQHFFIEGENLILDIDDAIHITKLPALPEGTEVRNVDVIVHLRRRPACETPMPG